MNDATDHAELTRLIADGHARRAATMLVERYAADVYALCRAMVRDARLAEDLSQDAFARALGALDGYRGEASPRTWLLKIARNRCLDHLDRARRAPWTGDDDEPDDHAIEATPPIDAMMRREDAERAMAALSEHERALVVLHFGHGVGYPQLADSFGLREGAVRMRISRALTRMREALEPTLERARGGPGAPSAAPLLGGLGWSRAPVMRSSMASPGGPRGAAPASAVIAALHQAVPVALAARLAALVATI
jgi:RNA polymerase sigma-70 factor (ECF subfamily)